MKKIFAILAIFIVVLIPFSSFAVIDYPEQGGDNFPAMQYPYYIYYEYTNSDERDWFSCDIEDGIIYVDEYDASYGSYYYFYTSYRADDSYLPEGTLWESYASRPDYRSWKKPSSTTIRVAFEINDIFLTNITFVLRETGEVINNPADEKDYYIKDEIGFLNDSEQINTILHLEKKYEKNLNSQFFIYFPENCNEYNAEQLLVEWMKTKSPTGNGSLCLLFYWDNDNQVWYGYIGFSGRFAMQLPDANHDSCMVHIREALDSRFTVPWFVINYLNRQYDSILYETVESSGWIEDWTIRNSVWHRKYRDLLGIEYADSDVADWRLKSAKLSEYEYMLTPDMLLAHTAPYKYDSYGLECDITEHNNHIWRFGTGYTDSPFSTPVLTPEPELSPFLPSTPDPVMPLPTQKPYDDTDWKIPDINFPNFMNLIYRKFPIKTFENTWSALNQDYARTPPSFKLNLQSLATSAGATDAEINFFPSEDIELADFGLLNTPFLGLTVLEFLRLLISAIMIWKTFGFVYTELTDNTF